MLCVSPVSTIASSSLETEQSQQEQLSPDTANVEANVPQDQQNITTQNGSQKTGKEPPTITILVRKPVKIVLKNISILSATRQQTKP